MRCKALLLLLLLLTSRYIFSQYQENLPQARPIPPNAAALFKTLERPIGTYTGTVPISFPLFGVSSGPLAANLSLDYNSTGGIKVEELGGPIGLGFNFNDGGGRITQSVRGKRPDDRGGILNSASSLRPSTWGCYLADVDNIDVGEVDMEVDVFMYSFNGYSGKFFIKENGQIIKTKNDGLKIDFGSMPDPNYGFGSWTITDPAGVKYVFGSTIANESSYSSTGGSGSTSTSSISYYLDYIEDMNGENQIWFTYTTTGNVFSTYSGGFLHVGPVGPFCAQFNTSYDQGSVTTDGTELLVSRIDARSGYILVNSTTAYPLGSNRITSIQLYDPANNLKKQYRFKYGTSFTSNRQKLISFSEMNSAGTDSLTTKFDYNEAVNLPTVFSPSVDIWGFYNGESNLNTGLIPSIVYNIAPNEWLDWTSWANRNANPLFGQANMLRKITFPSGGYRELEYEGNQAFAYGDFFQYHPNPSFFAPYMADKSFNETDFNNDGSSVPCLQHLFTINSTKQQAKFYFTVNSPAASCGAYTVRIMRLIDSTDLSGGTQAAIFTGTSTGNQVLSNGYYRVDVYIGTGGGSGSCTMNGIAGTWQECTLKDSLVSTPYGSFYKVARPVGGVRVKEIRDYDPLTNKINRRQYKYKLYSLDSNLTSGFLVSPVNILQTQNISTSDCQFLALTPGSSYPLATEGGSYVVYPEVRTIDSANGWIDQNFTYAEDLPPSGFPYGPPDDRSYKRGHLQAENTYDKNGVLLKQKYNMYYERMGNLVQYGYKYKPYWYQGLYNAHYTETKPVPFDDVGIIACNKYPSRAWIWTPYYSLETTLTPSGYNKDSTFYDYANYNEYYYLRSETTTSSDQPIKQRNYKYAFTSNSDFKFGLTTYEQTMKTTLLDKNYLQPLEVIDSVKDIGGSYSFLHGAKYLFGKFNADSLIYLKTFRSFKTATDSLVINYSAYDSSGNLREQYKSDDSKEVILWGYNRTYPVAKITGSSLSTVLGFVNLSIINNPASNAALRTELDKIRTGLAGTRALVTTYTYLPLFGMASMTDPQGKTIYYEYDLLGRLKLIKDQDNKALKRIDYRLVNPL